jgi:gliding motility-associated peptidyl-prolyl isomerase
MKKTLPYLILLILVSACRSPEARMPESVKSGSFISESAQRNKKLNENERLAIESLISKDSSINYIASETGFWYYYNTKLEQDTIQPVFGDEVQFNYSVNDLKGRIIYSSEEIGNQNYIMDKEELFTGLREGLKLMKPSETVTFIFPSQVAYGYYGDDERIGTNVPLVCEVTLNTIIQNKND